jgi:transcriptional regulator with XRE-family HTH domain
MARHRQGMNERLATKGDYARRVRKRAGLTQEAAAENASISTRTISDIERGDGASAIILRAYASAVDPKMKWSDLLTEEVREEFLGSTNAPSGSPAVPQPHPECTVVHALSGRWDLLVTFQRWRGRELAPGESVVVHGYMDLWIPMTGQAGLGVAIGQLQLRLSHPAGSHLAPYLSTILVVDEIDHVRCSTNALNFRSKTFSRFVNAEEGDRPLQDGVSARLTSGTFFSWTLFVEKSTPEVLRGQYAVIGDERDDATVTATRP